DLGEIDLLLAREREQEIERAFEALDVDHQGRIAARPLGRKIGFEIDLVGAHPLALCRAAAAPMSITHSARCAATSSLDVRRRATAAWAGAAAAPASAGTACASACISASTPLQ